MEGVGGLWGRVGGGGGDSGMGGSGVPLEIEHWQPSSRASCVPASISPFQSCGGVGLVLRGGVGNPRLHSEQVAELGLEPRPGPLTPTSQYP